MDKIEELKNILIEHDRRYPLMEVNDVVKLIYQNEFGPGHLLKEKEKALEWLKKEAKADGKKEEPIDIGNQLIRLNVIGFTDEECLEVLEQMIKTCAIYQGTIASLKEKLNCIEKLLDEGYFSFSKAELMMYLSDYAEKGYPMVSHSETFRYHYNPHYRVIKKIEI